jgi:multidrug efflux system outer membrane protein
MRPLKNWIFLGSIVFLLCSCSVGPDYKKPDLSAQMPADWRWKIAEPKDALQKGEWWKVFNDQTLDELEAMAVTSNQNLRAAIARVDEARSTARITRSHFFPELSLNPSFERQRTSGNPSTPIPFPIPSAQINTFSVPLDLSYEVDLWGRVRRSFEAARAQAQASVADYQNVLLALTADVAVNYFLVRSLDGEIVALRGTVELRNDAVHILSDRFNTGMIPEIDLAQAKTELANAKADLADMVRQRTETLDALALLCGKPASSFNVIEQPLTVSPPLVPPGLPASVLERRPDIASAERNLAAKNAQIGVARAAYFPAIHLTGQGGYLSADASTLFLRDSRVWSIGPGISLPLFNAGRTGAEVKQAEASYQEAIANYRQAVLAAFKEVEDSLAQITLRNEQAAALDEALVSSRHVVELSKGRYEAGTISYFELIDAQRNLCQQELQSAQLAGQRFASSVRLIKALGGGWDAKENTDSAP